MESEEEESEDDYETRTAQASMCGRMHVYMWYVVCGYACAHVHTCVTTSSIAPYQVACFLLYLQEEAL